MRTLWIIPKDTLMSFLIRDGGDRGGGGGDCVKMEAGSGAMWPRPGSRRPPPGATRCGVMLGAADAEWCRFGADSASAYPHVGGVFSGLTTPLLPEQDTGAHGEQAQSAPGGSDLPPWLGALAAPAGGRVATADSGSAGCVSHKPQSAQFCPHFTEGETGAPNRRSRWPQVSHGEPGAAGLNCAAL